jgi:hypothetical protein
VRKLYAGVGNQPAPVSGMMSAFACVDAKIKVDAATRSQKQGGTTSIQARPVRSHEEIGLEQFFVLFADLAQAGRSCFFAHLDQVFCIKA